MTASFLLVQLLGLVPSLIAITSLQSTNRGRILKLQILCCILWITHYAILGAATAVATNLIGIIRALLCTFNNRPWAKSRLWLAALIAMYLLSAAFTWQGPASALLTFSMLCTTVALWVHDMRLTRFLYLLNSPPVLIANLIMGSYSCAAIEVLALCSFALAVYRYDVRPALRTRKLAGKAAANRA